LNFPWLYFHTSLDAPIILHCIPTNVAILAILNENQNICW
jgi:hypothetical protein